MAKAENNSIIEQLAAEYEGLTYDKSVLDDESAIEEGYILITGQQDGSQEESTASGDARQRTWVPSSPECAKCPHKYSCNGACSLLVDNEIDEDKQPVIAEENER